MKKFSDNTSISSKGTSPGGNFSSSSQSAAYHYYCEAVAKLPLPLAWLDLDAMLKNAMSIATLTAGKNLRIVTKSIRCPDVLHRLLDLNGRIKGLMTFHLGESIFLSQLGFDDILVAYPTVQRDALDAVAVQLLQGKSITCMVDSQPHLAALNDAGKAHNVVMTACVDVDMSLSLPGLHFGVRRSPLNSAEKIADILLMAKKLPFVRVIGFMGYDAQIAGIGDAIPGKHLQNRALPFLKQQSKKMVLKRRAEVIEVFNNLGIELRIANGGGTGSMAFSAADPSLNEIAVGSGFFAPRLFDFYQDLSLLPAAGFALEVARQSSRKYLTCAGGGYVASGSAGSEKLPQPWLPAGLSLDVNEGAGEVQTPVYGEVKGLALGAPVFFRHAKAGELCERFDDLAVISGGKVIDHWKTYRGLGRTFL